MEFAKSVSNWLCALAIGAWAAGACAASAATIGADDGPGVVRLGADASVGPVFSSSGRLQGALDRVFGPGAWRETSGYRSPERENELRFEGAGTVAPGRLSRHSMGTPDAPGAYDVVVRGMSQERAAELLRASEPGFSRVLFEGAHGPEGPHLHIEMDGGWAGSGASWRAAHTDAHAAAEVCNSIYERVVSGQRNPRLRGCD